MYIYPECYLDEIVENQGKKIEFVSENQSIDFVDFIHKYMIGKTCTYLDRCDS